jgi:DNA-binding YbaB/EbfC family protein
MFENLRNLGALMGQARELREKMERMQNELARKTVEADSGAGAVRVVMNGRLEVVSVKLDRPLLAVLAGEGKDADQQMIEDLIAAAVNAALQKAQLLVREEMGRLTGDLNLPGMDKLLGELPKD